MSDTELGFDPYTIDFDDMIEPTEDPNTGMITYEQPTEDSEEDDEEDYGEWDVDGDKPNDKPAPVNLIDDLPDDAILFEGVTKARGRELAQKSDEIDAVHALYKDVDNDVKISRKQTAVIFARSKSETDKLVDYYQNQLNQDGLTRAERGEYHEKLTGLQSRRSVLDREEQKALDLIESEETAALEMRRDSVERHIINKYGSLKGAGQVWDFAQKVLKIPQTDLIKSQSPGYFDGLVLAMNSYRHQEKMKAKADSEIQKTIAKSNKPRQSTTHMPEKQNSQRATAALNKIIKKNNGTSKDYEALLDDVE